MPPHAFQCRYRLDACDRIVWVDAMWLAFAMENGAAGLTEETVLQRSLWDFVNGNQLCTLFQQIHERVRTTARPVTLPFRCDSPTLQRHMRLRISREPAGQLLHETILVRTLSQSPLTLLDSAAPRTAAVLSICSVCKRALLEPTGWLNLEDVAARLGLFDGRDVPQVRHCLCSDCSKELEEAANGDAA